MPTETINKRIKNYNLITVFHQKRREGEMEGQRDKDFSAVTLLVAKPRLKPYFLIVDESSILLLNLPYLKSLIGSGWCGSVD